MRPERETRLPGGLSAGCSAMSWETENGLHLWGRNFDHRGAAADCGVVCFPPGTEIPARLAPPGEAAPGARRADYAAVGIGTTALGGVPILYEGVNGKGLMGGQLYYRGFARYPGAPAAGRLPLQPPFLVSFCLAFCASVEEVVRLLSRRASLVGEPLLGAVPPLHWMFSDPTGESVVLEPEADGLRLHRNAVGVLTNSPPYPWHRDNLLNYAHLRPLDREARTWGGETPEPCFSGTGAAGLPGDWSSPSRFVRLAFLRQCAVRGRDEAEGAAFLFRLLQSAAFPLGAVELAGPDSGGGLAEDAPPWDYTVYSSVQCAETGLFYWTTYRDARPRFVELSRLAARGKVLRLPLGTEPEFRDLTDSAR